MPLLKKYSKIAFCVNLWLISLQGYFEYTGQVRVRKKYINTRGFSVWETLSNIAMRTWDSRG